MLRISRGCLGASTSEYALLVSLVCLTMISVSGFVFPFDHAASELSGAESSSNQVYSVSSGNSTAGTIDSPESYGSLLVAHNGREGGGSESSGTEVAESCESQGNCNYGPGSSPRFEGRPTESRPLSSGAPGEVQF